ncbi:NADH:flavin oxidoreductase [Massilia niabensis]|uniref:NADH:flavin oxidoreductase n=1 Tax=Massilia niabensis TaxID=544910 RepID=A0ABW0LBE7_9BURK
MSEIALQSLFSSFEYKKLKLRNRIVMSPMTRYFSPNGKATDEVAAYYARRAQGEVGLIISEGVYIDRPVARNVDTVPSFYGDALEPWKKVIADVHAAGAAMAPQLWHVGGNADFNFPDSPHCRELESPSGLIGPGLDGGRIMTEEDIADVVAAFVKAAVDAQRLGFDAIEFHGGHGYLFDSFFWEATNKRTDRYGGSTLRERTRFATEVISATRRAVGDDFTLMFRLSQWKNGFFDVRLAQTPDALEQWLAPLTDAGVDIFDCSQRRFYEREFEGSELNLAGWVKKLTGQPTITVGSVGLSTDLFMDIESGAVSEATSRTIREVAERLDRGEFDLVAVGRGMLADAHWARKVKEGRFGELRGYSTELMKTLD